MKKYIKTPSCQKYNYSNPKHFLESIELSKFLDDKRWFSALYKNEEKSENNYLNYMF